MKAEKWMHHYYDMAILMFVMALILLLMLSGCKPCNNVASSDTITRIEVKELVRDTTVYITDSSGLRAYLECDSLGRLRLKQITDYYAGQFVRPEVVIKDNYVKVDCKIDSGRVYVAWKERHEKTQQTVTTTKIVKENYITGWQWFQIWVGRIGLFLLILAAAFFVAKMYFKLPIKL